MEDCTDYFDRLPDEVIQLIFSTISDCKSLVRCMSVSKAFRQQSVRVASLSIVCPGNFSSYDERLHKIYSMVKRFQNLQSLVVRVGQPKEEPPSWARCMRYAEIGGSVEKFVFMAAKSGDFSELDCALLGLDTTGEAENGFTSREHRDTPQTAENLSNQGRNHEGLSNSTGGATSSERSSGAEDCAGEHELTNRTNFSEPEREGVENGSLEAWSDFESDDETGERVFPVRDESGVRQNREERFENLDLNHNRNSGKIPNAVHCRRSMQSSACFLRGPGQRRQLSDFSLRQVIAPSNDVLKRMLPVIHFAIVQGLNELRDSLPAFVTKFPELRRFLLVDMVESITVYMREHHIQEIRASYLQDISDWDDSKEALNQVEPCISGEGQEEKYGQGKLSSDEVDSDGQCVRDKVNVEKVIGGAHRREDERQAGTNMTNGGDLVAVASGTTLLEGCLSGDIEGGRDASEESGSEENPLVVVSEQKNETWGLKSVLTDRERKGKELVNQADEDGNFVKKKIEKHYSTYDSGSSSSCLSDKAESSLRERRSNIRGKGTLLEHHNQCIQSGESYFTDEPPCTNSAMYDYRSSKLADHGHFGESTSATSGLPDRPDRAFAYGGFVDSQRQEKVMTASFEFPSSGDSEDGATDVEEYYLGCLNSKNNGMCGSDKVLGSSDMSSRLRAFEKLIEGRWDGKNRYRDAHDMKEIREDSSPNGEISTVNTERETDQLLQLRYVEGWDGRLEGSHGENFLEREDAHRWKSCRFVREGKVDVASRHPFKRGLKNENYRMRECNRNIRFGCFRRRDDNLVSFDSSWRREDTRGYRSDGLWRREEGRCFKLVERAEKVEENLAMEANGLICEGDTTDSHSSMHVRIKEEDCRTCHSQGLSMQQLEASSSCSSDCVPGMSGHSTLSVSNMDGWKGKVVSEESLVKEPAEAGKAMDHILINGLKVEGSIQNGLHELKCASHSSHSSSSPDLEAVDYEGIIKKTERNAADGQTGIEGSAKQERLATETRNTPSLTNDLQMEREQMSTEWPSGDRRSTRSGSPGILEERPGETEAWRNAWRETWRERVRRLRDMRREAQGQGEHERDREVRRDRSREVLRKRQRDLEKEALSFDYTFWRAEQVAVRDYSLCDVSMCIATHAARPLREAEMEILTYAALAGPLLVATVSHVNKQHTCHNL